MLARHPLSAFYDADLLAELHACHLVIEAARRRPVFVLGWGAALLGGRRARPGRPGALEIQQRMRADKPNWRCAERDPDMLRAYKRGTCSKWRTADEHKRALARPARLRSPTPAAWPGPIRRPQRPARRPPSDQQRHV